MDYRTPERSQRRCTEAVGLEALRLDPEDEWLRAGAWVNASGYAVCTEGRGRAGRKPVRLHRLIMNAPHGVPVDHRNGDRLDNRRHNLRLSSPKANGRNIASNRTNTSGFVGVAYHKNRKGWVAGIRNGSKQLHIGIYPSASEANRARLLKEKELWGVTDRRLTAFLEAGIEVSDKDLAA